VDDLHNNELESTLTNDVQPVGLPPRRTYVCGPRLFANSIYDPPPE